MLTSDELLDTIETLEDKGVDLTFEIVMLQVKHRLRPDVPITIYIGGHPDYRDDVIGDMQ